MSTNMCSSVSTNVSTKARDWNEMMSGGHELASAQNSMNATRPIWKHVYKRVYKHVYKRVYNLSFKACAQIQCTSLQTRVQTASTGLCTILFQC